MQRELTARGWSGTRVVLLSVSFDPARDTPAVLRAYAKRFRADTTTWHFLTGPAAVVDRVIKAYGIPVKPAAKQGLVDHALPTLVIDQRGALLGHYEPDFTPGDVVSDLTKLLGP